MLEIRRADKSDIGDLVNLDNVCFDTYFYKKTKFRESDFQYYLCRKRSILFVTVLDSQIVGYVAGRIGTSRVRSIAHLESIAVSLAERKKGIGSRLLQLFIEEAKQQSCKMIMLEVAMANTEGLSFFSKGGFREIADLPEYYGRDIDGVLMQLNI